jgi:hypothetical protein
VLQSKAHLPPPRCSSCLSYMTPSPAFQAGYEGSIPFTRSSNKINSLSHINFRNDVKFSFSATKISPSVTRRNRTFSESVRAGLWRVCGELDNSKK